MPHISSHSSGTAQAFGAKIGVKTDGRALCLVVGRVSPIAAINAVNGSIAVQLTPKRILAVIELALLGQLQRDPDVALAGPVQVDQKRFADFVKLMGANPERP